MSNSNGPGQGSSGQPGSAGTDEVRTFPASHPSRGARRAVEAVKGNPTPTVIPGVDAPKLTQPTKS